MLVENSLDKKSASEDELDDNLPLQIVNTGIGELFPAAEISDSDDYDLVDANDPHRALNIMSLWKDERLPVLEHNRKRYDEKDWGKRKQKGKVDEYIILAKEKYGYNGEQALGMLFRHKHNLERAVLT